jgi:opacity protein-like surface antigen
MRSLSSLVFLLFFVSAAMSSQQGGEWKIQAYGGKSSARNSYINLSQPGKNTNLTFAGVDYGDQSFNQPIYYGFRVMYFPNAIRWLGIGIDFIHAKVYANPNSIVRVTGTENGVPVERTQRLGDSIQRFSISHGVNYLALTLIARLETLKSKSYPDGRLAPYVGLGFGPTLLHPESAIDGDTFQHFEWDKPTYQVLAGLEYFVMPEASVFIEYKYTNESFDVDVVDGTARTRVSMDHIVFGLSWKL